MLPPRRQRAGRTTTREASRGMQGTVREFSEETRSGSVILDDGTVLPLAAEVFSASGLRKLNFGQRVRIEVEGDPETRRVSAINLATL